MNLLMISGDQSLLDGKRGTFWYALRTFSKEWDRIDILCPHSKNARTMQTYFENVHVHPNPRPRAQARWIRQQGVTLHAIFHHAIVTTVAVAPFREAKAALRLAQDLHVPCVLDVHGMIGIPHAMTWRAWVQRLYARMVVPRLAHRAHATRATSKTIAELLIRWNVPARKIHVIPSCTLDPALFTQLPTAPPVQYDAVCCAPQEPNQRIAEILRAIASLKRARLLLIGDGPERQHLKHVAAQLNITHRVEFRDWPPAQTDLLQAIRSARVYVQNTAGGHAEQTAVDAMACGMPVLVTPVDILADVIEDGTNGFLTNGDPDHISDILQRLLDEPELREIAGAAARHVIDRLDEQRMITMLAHFLRSFA